MEKPSIVIWLDCTEPLRDVCRFVNASQIIMDGVKYKVPPEWIKDNNEE